MSLLITLIILIIVFALLWWLISAIPFPPPIANVRWIFYVILVIIAIIVLVGFIPGFSWPQ
jgi:hypothetical protein